MRVLTREQFEQHHNTCSALGERFEAYVDRHLVECDALLHDDDKSTFALSVRIFKREGHIPFNFENAIYSFQDVKIEDVCETERYHVFDDEKECRYFIATLINNILHKHTFEAP